MKTQRVLKGHPVSLHVLDFGLFKVHANGRIIGICGFLIQTSAGERILVDSGFPAKYAQDAEAATAEDSLGDFGVVLRCTEQNLPTSQLALAGTALEEIDLMIQTHTHIDHVGALHGCPQAPILMARAERSLGRPLYWRGAQPMEWPDQDYLLIDGDTQIGPGLQVLLVPGHAPGQLALFLELPDTGAVLLTSDAISRPEEMEEAFAGSWDETLAIHNGARLMNLANETGALVIYGHCPDQWQTLRKAPLFYN